MGMSRDEAILKIKKCLALSKSSNENEAATALRMAQSLMKEFQIDPDLLDIVEAKSASKVTKTPTSWESHLVRMIARAMQCKHIFSQGHSGFGIKSEWIFIGVDPAPEVAAYAFDVLYRQVTKARKNFIETTLKRVTVKKNKVRRADLFCDGWVESVQGLINRFFTVTPENTKERIAKYLQQTHGELGKFTPKDRSSGKALSDRAINDIRAGRQSGRSAQLSHAMNGGEQYAQLESKA